MYTLDDEGNAILLASNVSISIYEYTWYNMYVIVEGPNLECKLEISLLYSFCGDTSTLIPNL